MEEMIKQVKMETLRTVVWVLISCSVAGTVYYLLW